MIDRVLEPEAMDTADEAREYDAMDHETVNTRFVADMVAAAARVRRASPEETLVVDVGTGTARIPMEMCRAQPTCRVVGIDLAGEMLRVARRNLVEAALTTRVSLQRGSAAALPFRDACVPMVVSNSLIHHLPNPAQAFGEMHRIVSSGGMVFVRDLFRPPSVIEVERLVGLYAADASTHQRQLFADSLRAALTVDEVREAITPLRFAHVSVETTSDRHWTLIATRAG